MNEEQRQRVVRELRRAIDHHEARCGAQAASYWHNIADGLRMDRGDADALIALLEQSEAQS